MSPAASILVTALGIVLVAVGLRDVFQALFNPSRSATLSRTIMRSIWRLLRALAQRRPRLFPLAGPLGLVAVIACWAGLLIVGWALIFWPHVPDGFAFDADAEHTGLAGFVDAFYMSVVTLATLGYGDVTPDAAWLRFVAPFEAILGFGLLTASISWLGTIYPAIQRRRGLAYEIFLLREAQEETGVEVADLEPAAAAGVYAELTSRIVSVERDFAAFPAAYYFVELDDRFSLAAAAPYLYGVALQGADDGVDDHARIRAAMLRDALADLARTAANRFHGEPGESTEEALDAFARDHGRDPDHLSER